eukprot:362203-Chlamydomonas_euryale.AAC.2
MPVTPATPVTPVGMRDAGASQPGGAHNWQIQPGSLGPPRGLLQKTTTLTRSLARSLGKAGCSGERCARLVEPLSSCD